MIDLATISRKVEAEHQKKFDVPMKMHDLVPRVNEESGKLELVRDGDLYGTTKTGLSSYLEKIHVPQAFFNRCSNELRRDILQEHHAKTKNTDVLARVYNGEEKLIRYLGSSRYGVFDDIDIIKTLQEVDNLPNLQIREFYQSEDHLVLRALTADPIEFRNTRPVFPGIQIYNSETGRSAVKVQFLLWEQVCTNGLTLPREILKGFVKKHIGTQFTSEALSKSTKEIIESLPAFVDMAKAQIGVLTKVTGEDFLERLEKMDNIPKKIKEAIPEFLPNYAPSLKESTGMDIISSYTEAIQKYSWEQRTQYEDLAGMLMFGD